MKRKLFLPVLASVMLAAMAGFSVASGNSDNTTKNYPQEEWLKTVPESIRLLAGFEKFYTKMDYSINGLRLAGKPTRPGLLTMVKRW